MHWKILAALLGATLVIAACGGGDDDGDATPAPTATAPASTVTNPTPVAPVGTGAPLDPSQFSVVSATYVETSKNQYFIGEVMNNSDKNAIIGVHLSLTDAQGQEVGSGDDRLQGRSYTPPGQTMPFKMVVAGGPDNWANQTFTLTPREASEAEIARTYTDFAIEGSSASQAEQGITVQGVLRNTGTEAMDPIKLVFVARDADGKLVGAWGANPPTGLEPGAETIFAMPVLDVPAPPASYEITAYAYR